MIWVSSYQKRSLVNTTRRQKIFGGVFELMLTVIERGQVFTNEFGDIDDPFYDALSNMLERFMSKLKSSLANGESYSYFRPRLLQLAHDAAGIGWGYGDLVQDAVHELEAEFGDSIKS
jgi:hypothetical protein